jgi:hypothetical protein
MSENKDCCHKRTGSASPEGIYLYVRCMDCGDLLNISEVGQHQLNTCPGYSPPKADYGQSCEHCGFNFWDHQKDQGE